MYIAYSFPILMKLEFSGQIFEKILKRKISWKSVQWEPSCPMWTDGQHEANGRFSAISWTRLKAKALMLIKSGKALSSHLPRQCRVYVQRFVHVLCLRHQQVWHSRGHLTSGCTQLSRNISKEFISLVVNKLHQEQPEKIYTDEVRKTFSALAVLYRTREKIFRENRNEVHILNRTLCSVSFRYLLWIWRHKYGGISFWTKQSKAIPLQAWTGPEGSRRLRLPDFKTVGKVVSPSTGRLYPPGSIPGIHFWWRLSRPQGP